MADLETTAAAAKAVKLSVWWLYRNQDQIPAVRKAGRAIRWDVDELKEWMKEQADKTKEENLNGQ